METSHRLLFQSANRMVSIPNESVDLVVTSPPYPMIEMWDQTFSSDVWASFSDPRSVFEKMHLELDGVWRECARVVRSGGILAINIGDATRTIGGEFQLFSNHSRILTSILGLGFCNLPNILWRKPTNAPNKFMGSGMLPSGAYVTLEHEYILIFRKGNKRSFQTEWEKKNRRMSAYFWEERNQWFSDIWELIGTRQNLDPLDNHTRKRSAAFPFQLAYRLIQMFSVLGDTVLDPFHGTGTTSLASLVSGRNSVGIESEKGFKSVQMQRLQSGITLAQSEIKKRLENHLKFIEKRIQEGKTLRHTNEFYNFPVMTAQETQLRFPWPVEIQNMEEDTISVLYDLERSNFLTL